MVSTLDGDAKPLPRLPKDSTGPPLTVAASHHLRRLLTEALQEEKLSIHWLPHLEHGLADLVEAVRSGGWLSGAVKTRRSRLKPPPGSSRPEGQDAEKCGDLSSKQTDETNEAAKTEVASTRVDDIGDQALARLHERVATAATPATSTHLLVTLSPSAPARAFPDLGIDFDLRPHHEGCTFTAGSFSLPLFDDKHTNGSTILAGFEEWKEIVAESQPASAWSDVQIVGGKFTLRGVRARDDHACLARVLQLGVYCALAVQLELSFHRDCGIPLIFPAPPAPPPTAPAIVIPVQPLENLPPTSSTSSPPSKPPRRGKASSGIWNFLTKKTSEVIGRPFHLPNGGGPLSSREQAELQEDSPSKTLIPSGPTPSPSPRSALFPKRVSLDLVRTFSTHLNLSSSDHLIQSSSPIRSTPPTAVPPAVRRPFTELVTRIEHGNVVLSTSPDVHFRPPSLLLRLSQREAVSDHEHTHRDASGTSSDNEILLSGDERTGLSSILGWSSSFTAEAGSTLVVDEISNGFIGTKAFVRHQGLTVLYAEHVPAVHEPAVKDLMKKEKAGKDKAKAKDSVLSTAGTDNGTNHEAEDRHLPSTEPATAESSALTRASSSTDTAVATSDSPAAPIKVLPTTKPCMSAHWRTYRHFSRTRDRSLGEFIVDACMAAERGDLCTREGCGRTRKEHGMDWVHAAVKVVGTVSSADSSGKTEDMVKDVPSEDRIGMWCSCKICGKTTEVAALSDGSFLFSLSKFLEVLIYSTAFTSLSSPLCDHTLPPASSPNHPESSNNTKLPTTSAYPSAHLPSTRFNIRRHFQYRSQVFAFTLSPIDSDIFEVKVPRLQIVRSAAEVKKLETADNSTAEERKAHDTLAAEDEEKEHLRLEITDWWMGLKDHLVKLEDFTAGETARIRTKRLPSTPEASEDDESSQDRPGMTPRQSEFTTASTEKPAISVSSPPSSKTSLLTRTLGLSTASTSSDLHHPVDSLDSLKQWFLACELGLYRQLTETPSEHINDVRRRFRCTSTLAKRRMKAWQSKHAPKATGVENLGEFDSSSLDPEWFDHGTYVMPNSRVIVKEKDWGSVIAFTLSSEDYKRELSAMTNGRSSSVMTASDSSQTTATGHSAIRSTPSTLSLASEASSISLQPPSGPPPMARNMSAASTTTVGTKDAASLADDDDWSVWPDDDEVYSAVITRKEHPRDVTGLLGLRDVLRQQRPVELTPSGSGLTSGSSAAPPSTSGGMSSRFSSLGNSASKLIRLGIAPLAVAASAHAAAAAAEVSSTPPMAWAKPETELTTQEIRGEFRAGPSDSIRSTGLGEEMLSDILAQVEKHEAAALANGPMKDPLGSTIITNSRSSDPSTMAYASTTIKVSPSKFVRAPSAVQEASDEEHSLSASVGPDSLSNSRTLSTSSATSQVDLSTNGRTTPTPEDTARSETPSSHSPSHSHSRSATDETIAPPVPPKDSLRSNEPSTPPRSRFPALPNDPKRPGEAGSGGMGTSAATQGSITSTMASAIRYVLGTQAASPPSKHLGLLTLATNGSNVPYVYPPIDERPHLKYDFTLGKKLKFSCTVYYARQFDFLRKRCGVDANSQAGHTFDNDIIRSLERCVGWGAEGGKSKSSFLKSEDDKYIIKTLVNAWNVADLQVLLELAPSYFRFMDCTAQQASVLAKLMGFYTIEIHSLDSKGGNGTVKMKADLLVMENLFWNFKISPGRTFDLKGIAGRKVKPVVLPSSSSASSNKAKTGDAEKKESNPVKEVAGRRGKAAKPAATAVQKPLFDGEWIEGQQKAMILVEPHSKAILKEAIKNDADFLARSNIMDYSLLLGIDQERRQIACGLVDTIGSYTFAKTLEYKAKQGLNANSGKETTVVPPAEYQERFVNALESYFYACPDKWSKPTVAAGDTASSDDLPSVF